MHSFCCKIRKGRGKGLWLPHSMLLSENRASGFPQETSTAAEASSATKIEVGESGHNRGAFIIIKIVACGGGLRASARGPARRFSLLFNLIVIFSSFLRDLEFFSRIHCDTNSAQAVEPSCQVFNRRFSHVQERLGPHSVFSTA